MVLFLGNLQSEYFKIASGKVNSFKTLNLNKCLGAAKSKGKVIVEAKKIFESKNLKTAILISFLTGHKNV